MQTDPAHAPLHAGFNPLIRPYLVLSIASRLALTIVLLPLALLWVCGIGQWWARHYFARLECALEPTALRFRKGIVFQVEKTIPLENIQDVTFIEGPLLRHFNLSVLKFETAGQSAGQAHDMRLVGIIDAHRFRGRILAQRDLLKQTRSVPAAAAASSLPASDEALSLLRTIAERLDEIASRLGARD